VVQKVGAMTKLFKSIFFSILIISNVNAEDIVTDKSMKVAVGLGAGYWLFPVRFEYSFQFFDCLELAGYATPPVGNIESIANQAIDMFISYGSIVYLNGSVNFFL
jgi:hypothetical protein